MGNVPTVSSGLVGVAELGTTDLFGYDVKVATSLAGETFYVVDEGATPEIHQYDPDSTFDISTLTHQKSFDTSGKAGQPTGMAWKDDGSKLYVVGKGSDSVHQYSASPKWDIGSLTFETSFDVSGDETVPTGVTWKDDGTKMYIVGRGGGNVVQYDVSTAYDLTSTVSKDKSFSLQDIEQADMAWNSDGTKLYHISPDTVYEYDLSTAWDIGTASYNSVSVDLSSEDSDHSGVVWDDDGSMLYTSGDSNDNVYQYTVSTAYDLSSTVSFDTSTDVSGETTETRGLEWRRA